MVPLASADAGVTMISKSRTIGLLLTMAMLTGGAVWGVHALIASAGGAGSDYGLDTNGKEARLEGGGTAPYDLFIGVPVHRVPEVVARSGLAPDGWVQVSADNLATQFPDVYALGDVAALPGAKAGVFAENAARIVAENITARLRGSEPEHRYEHDGTCYIEFGAGRVAKVEANFLGGPKPTARLVGPSAELAADKLEFAATRRKRWFGSPRAERNGS